MMHVIELDSVKKIGPSKHEYRMINRASCVPFESVGDGPNIDKVVKALIESGADLDDGLKVMRDGVSCFNPMRLGDWGRKGEQPAHLRSARDSEPN